MLRFFSTILKRLRSKKIATGGGLKKENKREYETKASSIFVRLYRRIVPLKKQTFQIIRHTPANDKTTWYPHKIF